MLYTVYEIWLRQVCSFYSSGLRDATAIKLRTCFSQDRARMQQGNPNYTTVANTTPYRTRYLPQSCFPDRDTNKIGIHNSLDWRATARPVQQRKRPLSHIQIKCLYQVDSAVRRENQDRHIRLSASRVRQKANSAAPVGEAQIHDTIKNEFSPLRFKWRERQ